MITQEELKKYVSYDKDTGVFTRRIRTSQNTKIGDSCGSLKKNGYLSFSLLGKVYYCHRLAWLYEYGKMPKKIDHINHDKTDNRIDNLRDVSQRDNTKNSSLRIDNTTGTTGVYYHKTHKLWEAKVTTIDGKRISVGYFKLKEDAIKARKKAEIENNYHENHGKERVA